MTRSLVEFYRRNVKTVEGNANLYPQSAQLIHNVDYYIYDTEHFLSKETLMSRNPTPKVTPASADMKYEAEITRKAKQYAPMFKDAFPTETALLIAVDNSTRFLATSYEALNGNVTADYFCLHSPLSAHPDQLLALMVLFIDCGVFVPTDEKNLVFSLQNANTWKFAGFPVADGDND